MYSMSHHPPPVNGGLGVGGGGGGGGAGAGGTGISDGSGTINPAALSASGSNLQPPQPSPRGIKRSRSPDGHFDPAISERPDEVDESKPRKRGRPPKTKIPESPVSASQALTPSLQNAQTPQLSNQQLSHTSPSQASPTKSTPTKTPVLKALPTVRDHTTDQLNPEGDEYIPREFDEAGEKKVALNGALMEGRQYRCRTFFMPNRGDKLFMLATECAKVLSYRDSYLLFNKNRSLFKIIANQTEKNDLIQQDILPNSYRSRQIAIVTARSMFRQFGSRLVVNGRRVRDDYWESKARKQGFTEDDPAGEKRPGAAKQREAQAAAEASNANSISSLPVGEIIYSNGPGPLDAGAGALAPLPMINMNRSTELHDYSQVQRPRHEIAGLPYQDRSQPSTATELLNQTTQTAEFNKNLGQQRTSRAKFMDEMWRRPHESATPTQLSGSEAEGLTSTSQGLHSPQISTASGMMAAQQNVSGHASQGQSQMMAPQAYTQSSLHHTLTAQSPVRSMHQQLPGSQMHHRSPNVPMGAGSQHQPTYGYPQSQMWPSAQQQPSPLSQAPMQYGQHIQQQSPHMQQAAMHGSPQLHHSSNTGSIQNMPYNVMSGATMNAPGYPGVTRNVYQQSPTLQHYMQQQQHQQLQQQQQQQQHQHQATAASTQPGMPGWSPAPAHGQGQQGQPWQNY